MSPVVHEYLTFRRMITPLIVQLLFWIMVGFMLLGALILAIMGFISMGQSFLGGVITVFSAIVMAVIGPITIRIYFEIIILLFRVNETLTDIRNNTGGSNPAPNIRGFPVGAPVGQGFPPAAPTMPM